MLQVRPHLPFVCVHHVVRIPHLRVAHAPDHEHDDSSWDNANFTGQARKDAAVSISIRTTHISQYRQLTTSSCSGRLKTRTRTRK